MGDGPKRPSIPPTLNRSTYERYRRGEITRAEWSASPEFQSLYPPRERHLNVHLIAAGITVVSLIAAAVLIMSLNGWR